MASSSSVIKGVSRREVEEGESLVVERDPDGLGSNPDGPMGRSLAGDDRLRLRSLIGLIFSLTTFLLSQCFLWKRWLPFQIRWFIFHLVLV